MIRTVIAFATTLTPGFASACQLHHMVTEYHSIAALPKAAAAFVSAWKLEESDTPDAPDNSDHSVSRFDRAVHFGKVWILWNDVRGQIRLNGMLVAVDGEDGMLKTKFSLSMVSPIPAR